MQMSSKTSSNCFTRTGPHDFLISSSLTEKATVWLHQRITTLRNGRKNGSEFVFLLHLGSEVLFRIVVKGENRRRAAHTDFHQIAVGYESILRSGKTREKKRIVDGQQSALLKEATIALSKILLQYEGFPLRLEEKFIIGIFSTIYLLSIS